MPVAAKIEQLSCLKCGSRSNLTAINYSKKFRHTDIFRAGGAPSFYHDTGHSYFKTPVCNECLSKIKKWKLIYYLTIGFVIILSLISGIIYSIQTNLGFLILIPLTLLNLFVFVLAHGGNPRMFNKFTFYAVKTEDRVTREYLQYVRPLTSDKWVKFETWTEIMRNSNSTTQYELPALNPFTWKLPLIGTVIALIAVITPAYIIISGMDLQVYWFLSFYYSNSFTFVHIDLPTLAMSIFFYIIILLGTLITIKQAYLLKRANTSLKGSLRNILIAGIIILLITILQITFRVQIIGPALIGLLIGSILIIAGPVNQIIRNKNKKLN